MYHTRPRAALCRSTIGDDVHAITLPSTSSKSNADWSKAWARLTARCCATAAGSAASARHWPSSPVGIGADLDGTVGETHQLGETAVAREDPVSRGHGEHALVGALDDEPRHLDQEFHASPGVALGVEDAGLLESQRTLPGHGVEQRRVGVAEVAVETPGKGGDPDDPLVDLHRHEGPGLMVGGAAGQLRVLGVALGAGSPQRDGARSQGVAMGERRVEGRRILESRHGAVGQARRCQRHHQVAIGDVLDEHTGRGAEHVGRTLQRGPGDVSLVDAPRQGAGDPLQEVELGARRSGGGGGAAQFGHLGDEDDHPHRLSRRRLQTVEGEGERARRAGIVEGAAGLGVDDGDARLQDLAEPGGDLVGERDREHLVHPTAHRLGGVVTVEQGQAPAHEEEAQVGVDDGHAEGALVDEGRDGRRRIGLRPGQRRTERRGHVGQFHLTHRRGLRVRGGHRARVQRTIVPVQMPRSKGERVKRSARAADCH